MGKIYFLFTSHYFSIEGKSNDKETISKSQQNNQQITKILKEQNDFYKANNEAKCILI